MCIVLHLRTCAVRKGIIYNGVRIERNLCKVKHFAVIGLYVSNMYVDLNRTGKTPMQTRTVHAMFPIECPQNKFDMSNVPRSHLNLDEKSHEKQHTC